MQFILPALVICVIVIISSVRVDGAVERKNLRYDDRYGESIAYCQHGGIRLLPGSKIKDYKRCQECLCTSSGYYCSDLTNTYSYDKKTSKCKNVKAGCENKWVLKKDVTQECPDDLIPEFDVVRK